MSLYLKYRPKTLDDLVGQHHVIDILVAQARSGQLGHSYLLCGPRGTGKTSTARLLAKIINCTTVDAHGSPDLLNDPIAKTIDDNKSLDFVEIDAASHTGVDNIREEIIDKALYPPTLLKKKVYVIDEVHMLSKGAFNALLKIMEEPPSYLVFVLATTELHKVPDTIVSRCQVFNFRQLTIEEISERLAVICTKEHIEADPQALRLIAKLSGGALRDAIKYLEQISILGPVTEKNVAQFLGVMSEQLLNQSMDLLLGSDPHAWIAFLDHLVTNGIDLSNLVKEILLRLDEHFLDDPHMFSPLAGMMREISSESRRYPHPILVRKAKTWKWFEERGKIGENVEMGKGENGEGTTTAIKHQDFSTNATAKHAEGHEHNKNEPCTTHKTVSPSARNDEETLLQASSSEGESTVIANEQGERGDLQQEQSGVASPAIRSQTSDNIPSSPEISSEPQKISNLQTPVSSPEFSSSGSLSPEALMELLLTLTTNPMIKSALKQYAMVDEITNEVISLVIINEQFYHTLSKAETSHELEKKLAAHLGHEIQLRRISMTKEQWLAKQI